MSKLRLWLLRQYWWLTDRHFRWHERNMKELGYKLHKDTTMRLAVWRDPECPDYCWTKYGYQ